jgi:hypothetical protein
MVKIQNISKDERKIYENGKWIFIKPQEIVEVNELPEQKDIFKEVSEKKTKSEKKNNIKKIKEVKEYDSSSN